MQSRRVIVEAAEDEIDLRKSGLRSWPPPGSGRGRGWLGWLG